MTRRHFVAGLAATAASAAGQPRPPAPPRVRTGPLLCLYSRLVPEIDYSQLGTVLSGLGFDGCDLSVERGGTVEPAESPVDLVRAIEIFSGSGIELPVITTSFLNIGEPWARNCLGLAGRSGVPFFRTGYSRLPAARLAEHRYELDGLAAYGRAAGMGIGLPYPGSEALIRDMDPQWTGYDFDTALGTTQGSVTAALPRIRMISLRDIRRQGDRNVPCPLGEGVVDWPAFFATLAHARFSGPLTIQIDYQAEDRLQAIKKDLAFARKLLTAAYQKEAEPPTSLRPSAAPLA